MLDCILIDGRKGRCWGGLGGAGKVEAEPADLALEPPQRDMSPFSDTTFLAAGLRRDRTPQLVKLRSMARERRRFDSSLGSAGQPVASSGTTIESNTDNEGLDEVTSQLQSIYEVAASVHTSLASKLAQHNGLCQFGASFSHRAPPLELRLILPELEVSIEELLASLRAAVDSLETLEVPCGCRNEIVRSRLDEHVKAVLESASTSFKEQREHLKVLALSSPLHSPRLDPTLSMSMSRRFSEKSTDVDVHSTPEQPLRLPRSAWESRAGSRSTSRSSGESEDDDGFEGLHLTMNIVETQL
mmetsp:Transcript_32124/g.73496  ORF Transcript_32124/g.73496 Transcript_32124/m.73496 type:complete len:300 (-) Transcript_32124:13-912(-)